MVTNYTLCTCLTHTNNFYFYQFSMNFAQQHINKNSGAQLNEKRADKYFIMAGALLTVTVEQRNHQCYMLLP